MEPTNRILITIKNKGGRNIRALKHKIHKKSTRDQT